MTKNQVLSSLGCSILGTLLISLLVISFLVWFGLTWWLVAFVVILALLAVYLNVKRVRKTVSIIFKLNKQKKEYRADNKFTEWFFSTTDDEDDAKEKDDDAEEEEAKQD